MSHFSFELHAQDGRARAGIFFTPHGPLPTPVFAPVGTQATVKAVSPRDLHDLGATLVLANTYHLLLRPGDELIARQGGLHRFMGWTVRSLPIRVVFKYSAWASCVALTTTALLFAPTLTAPSIG